MEPMRKYYWFFLWAALLTLPFYAWGIFFPVGGLPFGLPISFVSILVPMALAIVYAYREGGRPVVGRLFLGILDVRKATTAALALSVLGMPLVALLAYKTATLRPDALPDVPVVAWGQLPVMFALYFLGAIPEELGWTATLTGPLVRRHGPLAAGAMIGLFWGLWHVLPWSWEHSAGWIAGMMLFDVLIRMSMAHAYAHGGGSLLAAVLTHAMINVCISAFPNAGSHFNPWLFALWAGGLLAVQLGVARRGKLFSA